MLRVPISPSIAGTFASRNFPKSTCRHGLSLLIDPQNDFFLIPTSAKVVRAGKLVPEISTDVALRHVYRELPVHSKLHTPPLGCSVRTASQSPCGMVILTVRTLSIAYSESIACCCWALIVISPSDLRTSFLGRAHEPLPRVRSCPPACQHPSSATRRCDIARS